MSGNTPCRTLCALAVDLILAGLVLSGLAPLAAAATGQRLLTSTEGTNFALTIADLLVVAGDPLADPLELARVEMVMINGVPLPVP